MRRAAGAAVGARSIPRTSPLPLQVPYPRLPPNIRSALCSARFSVGHPKARDDNAVVAEAAAAVKPEPAHGSDQNGVGVVPPGRQRTVSLADIAEQRAKAGRLVALTAAYSDTDMFKGLVSDTNFWVSWTYWLLRPAPG